MSIAFSIYNSTATAIVIDDIPVSKTVPAYGSIALDAATTLADVRGSMLIRHYDLSGQISVNLNGRTIKLSKLGLSVG